MLSAWENYCPDQVTFPGAEPSHPTTIAVVKNDISWKLQSIRRSPCLQKCYTASIKNKQLKILKMATCFIAYVLKLTKEKHIIKSAIKSEFLI